MLPIRPTLAAALLGVAVAWPVAAIQPQRWVHSTEADFEPGETDNTVVTNLGDIKLAIETATLGEMPEQATVVYDVQPLNGTMYVAAGPEGKLLALRDGEISVVAEFETEQVFALDVFNGQLLIALSGSPSRLAVLDGEDLRPLVELPEVRYIWDILPDGHSLIVATGTDGQVLRVDPQAWDAQAETNPGLTVLLDAEPSNVLCLARSGEGGPLFAGTDTEGLVFRLTPRDGEMEAFVLYDAAEPEIGALLATEDGTVFAGTADAEQARPGRLGEAVTEEQGRPAVVEPTEEGDAPEEPPTPGDLPDVPPQPEPAADESQPTQAAPAAPKSPESPDVETGTQATPQQAPVRMQAEPDVEGAQEQVESTPDQPQPDEPTEITQAQRDRLRELVRARLEAARKSGTLQGGGVKGPGSSARVAKPAGDARGRGARGATKEGNAVYRIGADGFVREVFRESVMVLAIAPDPERPQDRLIVTTGSEGQVFRIDLTAGETSVLADLDAEQIPAVAVQGQDILVGTANPAQIVRLAGGTATTGSYISPILDASQTSLWGAMRVTSTIPQGAMISVETRSGNVEDPDTAPWSKWSDAVSLLPDPALSPLQPREVKVSSPPARFFQYRLTLTSEGEQAPAVERVETAYVTPNMRPEITSFKTTVPKVERPKPGEEAAEPQRNITIEWEATDPNEDALLYRLAYRPAASQRYIDLAEDLEEPTYEWNTRRVPDGWYVLRVTASDRLDNPPDMALTSSRRSAPVLVDNTPPQLENLQVAAQGASVQVSGVAVDELSAVDGLSYAVDGQEIYEPVLPADLIFDSTRERFSVSIDDLSPGPHVVTLRVRDTRGNAAYRAVFVTTDR